MCAGVGVGVPSPHSVWGNSCISFCRKSVLESLKLNKLQQASPGLVFRPVPTGGPGTDALGGDGTLVLQPRPSRPCSANRQGLRGWGNTFHFPPAWACSCEMSGRWAEGLPHRPFHARTPGGPASARSRQGLPLELALCPTCSPWPQRVTGCSPLEGASVAGQQRAARKDRTIWYGLWNPSRMFGIHAMVNAKLFKRLQ